MVERWLLRRWYGDVRPGIGLRALAGAYALARRLPGRNAARRLTVPVVVVGNFTVGGTGKTPLVIAIARHFAAHGWRPGIVSRGYGRKSTRPIRVEAHTSVQDCGDEPRLIFERTGLPVFVDADRVAAAERAIASDCNLVIADDGLQHHRLARDIEIEVVDGERRYGNGLLLPAGPLRERPRRCDFRVVTGDGQAKPGDIGMGLDLDDALAIDGSGERRSLPSFLGRKVHAVAGIGNPQRFFSALARAGLEFEARSFPDHHEFRREDFPDGQGSVLMTEKDAVKCRRLGLTDAWAIPVRARLPAEFFANLLSRLGKP